MKRNILVLVVIALFGLNLAVLAQEKPIKKEV